MPEHRKKKKTFNVPGHAHELTFSCYRRLPLLDFDPVRKTFLSSLRKAKTKWKFHVWAYVLMPEHVHLLVFPLEENHDVSKFLKSLKKTSSDKALSWLRKNRPDLCDRLAVKIGGKKGRRFWQRGGGYDRNLYKAATIWKAIDYIHANPVRRGLAAGPLDWRWSSARWHAMWKDVEMEMDRFDVERPFNP